MDTRVLWRLLAVLGAVAVMMTVLASCQLNTWGSGGDFVGRTYHAVEVTENAAIKPVLAGTELSVTFTEDGITASAGCNTMFSTNAGIEDSVLRVGPLVSTELACDPAVMDQEQWWADFLTSGPAADVGDRSLTLASTTTQVELVADETIEDLPLTGTTWTLDTIISGEAASSVPQDAPSTLRLTDQAMTITVGTCRASSVPVTLTATTITYDADAFGASSCSDEAATVDAAVVATLRGGSVEFRIDGTRLTLTGPDGRQLGYLGV